MGFRTLYLQGIFRCEYCANGKGTVSIPIYNINCIFLYYSKFPNGKSAGQYTCALLYLSYKQVYQRCKPCAQEQQSEYGRCLR